MTVNKSYRWENDPSLSPTTDKQQAQIDTMVFETFQRQGLTPDSIRDKDVSKAYAAWLADQDNK